MVAFLLALFIVPESAHGPSNVQTPRSSAQTQVKDRGQILDSVRAAIQDVMGSPPVDSQPLAEAGLDSLGAVELRNSISSRFLLPDLPATLTFDYPTIAALTDYIAGKP